MTGEPSALLLTGTVGAGKTTTARALGDLLRADGVPHAVVDLDALREAWPSPPDDPFHERLALANLRDVARNHLAAGARRLVVAGVLEDPAHRALHADAVGVPLTVCRLRPALDVVAGRLRGRHAGDPEGLRWHLHRSGELDAVLHRAGIGDVVVDVGADDAPADVARAVLRAVHALTS
ncbi:zeta toxin family protein [Kineococcus aurantiacus]|uniref:UDP-N-acetylglucosamine kinase n=1 Tax=Kineococcus aurantiacus TaxID=37633 RepID=A0A7Y9DL51_9ACTN|nr:putative kinase [Kineococcus aurantiacus]